MVKKETVNHPSHYTSRAHECIDEMIAVFGTHAVIDFCKCNAWKYRYRANAKGNYEEDMEKADWYIRKMMELQLRENTERENIDNSCKNLRDELQEHGDLYNGFLASIESSLKEQKVSALPFQPESEIAEKILNRIIGEE